MRIMLFSDPRKQQFESNLKNNSKWYYIDGFLLMLLGVIAVMAPVLAASFIAMFIGVVLLCIGIAQIVLNVASERPWTYYVTATVTVIAGALMLANPHAGVLALAGIMTVLFFIQGMMQVSSSVLYYPNPGWGWLLSSGIVTILLAVFIFVGWPLSATWILAVILGINLFMLGLALVMLTRIITRG